ncbi:N-acetylmuramoyl-L-alanine amidase [Lysobacter xanthus]
MLPDLPPLPVRVDPLPYEARLEPRPLSQVDLIVIHCTEVPDLAMARTYGEKVLYPDSGTGNSGHFYIDRDGALHQYVAPERTAHHTRGYNPRSIGIELVNTGRYPRWYDRDHQAMDEPYTPAQIDTLVALLRSLAAAHPALRFVAGHEDLDTATVEATDDPSVHVRRKRDPGPLFPWDYVLANVPLQRLAVPPP